SLSPRTGRCAILFPHGVLFRQEEADMRRKLIEADVIECVLGLVLQLYLGTRAPFVVPIFGHALMPAPPCRPCQNVFHALLGGQHEAPEEAPNLPPTLSRTAV